MWFSVAQRRVCDILTTCKQTKRVTLVSFSYEGWLPKQRRGVDLGGGAVWQWIHASWYVIVSLFFYFFSLFFCLSDFFWSLWHCIFVKIVFLCMCHMLTHPKSVNRDVLSINQRNSCEGCTLKQQQQCQKYNLPMEKGYKLHLFY